MARRVKGRLIPLETELLTLLEAGPDHGWSLMERQTCARTNSAVYRALRRLEEWGYLVSAWEAGAAGPRADRRMYKLRSTNAHTTEQLAKAEAYRNFIHSAAIVPFALQEH